MALRPPLAPTGAHLSMAGYTEAAFGRSSSKALEASSGETLDEQSLDPQSHVDPITRLRGPCTASHASDRIEGLPSSYTSLKKSKGKMNNITIIVINIIIIIIINN